MQRAAIVISPTSHAASVSAQGPILCAKSDGFIYCRGRFRVGEMTQRRRRWRVTRAARTKPPVATREVYSGRDATQPCSGFYDDILMKLNSDGKVAAPFRSHFPVSLQFQKRSDQHIQSYGSPLPLNCDADCWQHANVCQGGQGATLLQLSLAAFQLSIQHGPALDIPDTHRCPHGRHMTPTGVWRRGGVPNIGICFREKQSKLWIKDHQRRYRQIRL